MRAVVGFVAGLALGVAGPVGATVLQPAPPAGVPFHPFGTTGPPILPAECDVLGELQAEQHRSRRGFRPEVRELVVYRLECEAGDRRRTVVARGPWLPALDVERPAGR